MLVLRNLRKELIPYTKILRHITLFIFVAITLYNSPTFDPRLMVAQVRYVSLHGIQVLQTPIIHEYHMITALSLSMDCVAHQ